MSPNGSKGPAGHYQRGFTLIEVMISMAVAVLLIVAVIRFYKDSYRTYNTQEQIADRNQNAHYLVNRFVEVMQQAGSALPDTGWAVLTLQSGKLTAGSNPRGAEHFSGSNTPSSEFVAVGDASGFRKTQNLLANATHVLVDYAAPAKLTEKFEINRSYTGKSFTDGVKDNAKGMDSICLKVAVNLDVGDRIYGYREDQYLLIGGNLVIRPNGDAAADMVLAENIDSLGFTFRTESGAVTTDWKFMRSVSLTVRARTSTIDPRLKPPGYRKITLPMNVILRNKV